MEYQRYRNGILKVWDYIKKEDLQIETDVTADDEEFFLGGLCNPKYNVAFGRTDKQPCPFDTRSEKNMDDKPCIDNCQVFVKGLAPHKMQIIMSKFLTKMITREAVESIKSLAKACRGQKGVSKVAAKDFINVADKVISSTDRFGGFNFSIVNGAIRAERRSE